jgi:membrane associated rhomboid family serine protease
MAYGTRFRSTGYASSYHLPTGVKWLLISNTAIFLLYFLTWQSLDELWRNLWLSPLAVVGHGALWQLFTYMFLHDPRGFSHILFNMFALWMFGADLERDWGTRRFLQYYFLCGVGAGLCDVTANLLFGNPRSETIGASGAIFGLLLAFGYLYPDRTILFSFLFPIKAKYFVAILGAIEFLLVLRGVNSGVSNVAHLGGMLFGFIYLRYFRTRRVRSVRMDPLGGLRGAYDSWKLNRAKKKFQVYIRKHGSHHHRDVN